MARRAVAKPMAARYPFTESACAVPCSGYPEGLWQCVVSLETGAVSCLGAAGNERQRCLGELGLEMVVVGNIGDGSHRCWIKVKKEDWCPAAVSGMLVFSG